MPFIPPTSFGHQDGVVSIDCLAQERPVTAGIDKTVRVWKIIEESHLVYQGHKWVVMDYFINYFFRSSIDTVKMINDKSFVSGSQDGYVSPVSHAPSLSISPPPLSLSLPLSC